MRAGRRIRIEGTVQGVGFRPWIYRLASELGLTGSVRNATDCVTIDAYGEPDAIARLITRIPQERPPAASIASLHWRPIPGEAPRRFSIEASDAAGARQASVPPDLATCGACLEEILDPEDRRFAYPFTNCTECGPRFTIIRGVPYDRPATTMAPFEMCDACRREYEDVEDRRFHAQPNACHSCGPTLSLLTPDGCKIDCSDPIRAAADAIRAGEIVAVKGVGGYHLACDAMSEAAVQRLRARKHREHKPFAVMVESLARAEHLAWIDDVEAALLTAVERPIVLLRSVAPSPLAPSVADGAPRIGLLLPYTPLHTLLLLQVGSPVVMTSGNLSEAPIVHRDADAITHLGPIVDLICTHDRDIERHADDSVATVIGGAPLIIRRARGYVPRPVRLSRPFAKPVLATGGQLKNTFCVGVGDCAYLSQHIGDLDDLDAFDRFAEAIEQTLHVLAVEPEVIAHDMHPDYLSTRYARERAAAVEHTIAVQHHHAHVAAVAADRGIDGPVLGLAYDGSGYGPDCAMWGGELLGVDGARFERLATLRPIGLPGGDRAVREVWRIALAALLDAFGAQAPIDALSLFETVAPDRLRVVRGMIDADMLVPAAHGAGRYFDAIGALALCRSEAHYEGEIAVLCEAIADPDDQVCYPAEIDCGTTPWQVDLRPLVRAAVRDLLDGRSPRAVSARFHNGLCAASVAVLNMAIETTGPLPIVLSGGCFQNARLSEGLIAGMRSWTEPILPRSVPVGDGGLALGQAVIADATVRAMQIEDGRRACV